MHDISVAVLASGSSGNSHLISLNGSRLLIDAGLTCREMENRLSHFGAEPSEVGALLLTHEHVDHVRGAQRFCSRHGIPVYGTRGTLSVTRFYGIKSSSLSSGGSVDIGGASIHSIPVSHFAAEPVGFRIQSDGFTIGVASDLGSVTREVKDGVAGVDLLLLEANYDEIMLKSGSYPESLKRTILGSRGHLSNDDAGALCASSILKPETRVVLVHLSKLNNTSEKALGTVAGIHKKRGLDRKVEAAEHGAMLGPFKLR